MATFAYLFSCAPVLASTLLALTQSGMNPAAKWIVAGYILGKGSLIMGLGARFKVFGGAKTLLSIVFLLHFICAAIIVWFAP